MKKNFKRCLAVLLAVAMVTGTCLTHTEGFLWATDGVGNTEATVDGVADETEGEGAETPVQGETEPVTNVEEIIIPQQEEPVVEEQTQPEESETEGTEGQITPEEPTAEEPTAPVAEAPEQTPEESEVPSEEVERIWNVVFVQPAADGGTIRVWADGEGKTNASYNNGQYIKEVKEGTTLYFEIETKGNFKVDQVKDQYGNILNPESANGNISTYKMVIAEDKQITTLYKEEIPKADSVEGQNPAVENKAEEDKKPVEENKAEEDKKPAEENKTEEDKKAGDQKTENEKSEEESTKAPVLRPNRAPANGSALFSITEENGKNTVNVGETLTLKDDKGASGLFQTDNWKSSNPNVATVVGDGKTATVTGVSAGTVTITHSWSFLGDSNTYEVTVLAPSVESITITADGKAMDSLQMNVRDTKTLGVTVTPDNAKKDVKWTSSDTSVVSVSADGKVTANEAGEATITAAAADASGKSASITVTVSSVSVTGITVAPKGGSEGNVLYKGGTLELAADVQPQNATEKTVTWSSSDENIATVDENGVVTGVSEGEAAITATSNEEGSTVTGTYDVTVQEVTLTEFFVVADRTFATVGETVNVHAIIKPEEYPQGVNWTSGNEEIATVDENGVVTTKKAGFVKITGTSVVDPESSASVTIEVVNVRAEQIKIIGYDRDYLIVGDEVQLNTSVLPETVVDKVIEWSSSDASIATVDGTGKVVAKGQGTVTIRAEGLRQGVYDEIQITVYKAEPKTITIGVWVTNQDKNIPITVYLPADGTPVVLADVIPSHIEGDGESYLFTGTVYSHNYNSGDDWGSIIKEGDKVARLKFENGQVQFSSDLEGENWNNAATKIAAQYDIVRTDTEGESDSDVKVILGDWPYGPGKTSNKIIQVIIKNEETGKNDYDSGSMYYDNNSEGTYGKIRFNCDESKYEVTNIQVKKYSSTYGQGEIVDPSANEPVSVKFDRNNGYEKYVITSTIKAKEFTVNYDANGGTSNVPETKKIKAINGNKVTVESAPTPTKDGHIFGGWEYGGKTYFGGESFEMPPRNVTFTAKWIKASEVIVYQVNNPAMGTVSRANERIGENTGSVRGSAANPKDGYRFVHWKNAKGEIVSTDNTYIPEKKPETYTAVFAKNDFTITTSIKNGTITPDQTVEYGKDVTISYSANDGYEIVKVTVDKEDVDVKQFASSYEFKNVSANHKISVETQKIPEYQVTFDSAGGTEIDLQTVRRDEKATRPSDPTKEGYIFDNWYLNGKVYNFDTPVTENITLVAKWNRDTRGFAVTSYEGVYDGGTHSVTVTGTLLEGEKFQYSTDGTNWFDQNPEYTDVTVNGQNSDGQNVQVRVVSGKTTVWEEKAFVKITKRPVTVTGRGWNVDQPYTGKEYKETGYDFANVVSGQTASISYELKGTEVGPYTGTFGNDFKVMSGAEDVTANYTLKGKTAGTLNIVKSEVANYVTLETTDVIKTYDGTEYTAGTARATDANGKTAKVEYSVDGQNWTENPTEIKATNVSDSVMVQVRASVEGSYEGYVTGTQELKINRCEVTVTGHGWNEEQPYTGKTYSTKGYTFDNVVNGQIASITYSLSGTEVGSYTGVFGEDFKVLSGTKNVTANYELTGTTPGKLKIGSLSSVASYVTLTPQDVVETYSDTAYATGVATAVDTVNGKPVKIEYSINGEDWTEKPAEITAIDVDDTITVQVRASVPGIYAGYVEKTQVLAIMRRSITLKANDASKAYDGDSLTEAGAQIVSSGALVGGQSFTVTTEGSQTFVGESTNVIKTVTIRKDSTQKDVTDNYDITKQPGTLTVTDGTETDPVNPDNVVTKTHEDKQYGLGDTIEFTINVTNIYDETKTITVVEQSGVIITEKSVFENVQPGETVTTTAEYVVTETDLLAGSFTNNVTAQFEGEKVFENTDEADDLEEPIGHLTVLKNTTSTPANGGSYALGETIAYEITVTNDGNLTLSDIDVTDSLSTADGQIIGNIESLAPEASEVFNFEYTVTEADILAGKVINNATVTGTSPDPENPPIVTPGDKEVPTETAAPSLAVVKEASAPDDGVYNLGDVITYTITVTNNGNVTITDVKVEDALTGNAGENVFEVGTLKPNEVAIVTAEYTVTEEDILTGEILNEVIATGTKPDGEDIEGNGTETVVTETKNDHITVAKETTSNPGEDGTYGLDDTITYEIIVTNDGNLTINDVIIEDILQGGSGEVTFEEVEGVTINGNEATIGTMKPGDVVTLECSYVVTEEDLGKTIVNVATATGESTDPENPNPEVTPGETEDRTEEQDPSMSVVKTVTSDNEVYNIGDEITYQIEVANTGNITLNNVVIEDNLNASGQVTWADGIVTNDDNEAIIETLAPGAAVTLECSYEVVRADAGLSLVNAAIGNSDETDPTDPSITDPTEVEDLYTLTINYVYADGTTAAPSVTAQYLAGETFGYTSPTIDGYTADYAFVRSDANGMPASDLVVTVTYTAAAAPVTPAPVTPAAPATPAPAAVTPAPAAVTPTPPAEPVGAEVAVDNEGNVEIRPVVDEEVPLANRDLDDHECCVLHFLLMLAAMIIYAAYTRSMKKRQERIAELADELETEMLKRKQETAE